MFKMYGRDHSFPEGDTFAGWHVDVKTFSWSAKVITLETTVKGCHAHAWLGSSGPLRFEWSKQAEDRGLLPASAGTVCPWESHMTRMNVIHSTLNTNAAEFPVTPVNWGLESGLICILSPSLIKRIPTTTVLEWDLPVPAPPFSCLEPGVWVDGTWGKKWLTVPFVNDASIPMGFATRWHFFGFTHNLIDYILQANVWFLWASFHLLIGEPIFWMLPINSKVLCQNRTSSI